MVRMADNAAYDPRSHWDERACRSAGDALRAACRDDPLKNMGIDRVQRRVVNAAFRRIEMRLRPSGARLLDYGCGPGRWVRRFQGRGYRYSGVDLVESMVELARAHNPGADIRPLDGDRIPFADAQFAVVTSIAVVHHNPYAEQQRILAELRRVLRPGGWLLLFESVGRHAGPGAGEFPRPLEEWVSVLAGLGLELRWHRGARYEILAAAAEKLARSAAPDGIPARAVRAAMRGALLRWVGAITDPWLLSALPAKYWTRVAMLFN